MQIICFFIAVSDVNQGKSGHGTYYTALQPTAGEYYDDFTPVTPSSAYIPTAPYPASIYGRPPFWVRLQRWNPFSRFVD